MVEDERDTRRESPLPFARPLIEEDDIAEVVEAFRSGWIPTGSRVQEFERRFAGRIGTEHAIARRSATAALHRAPDTIYLQDSDSAATLSTAGSTQREYTQSVDRTMSG